MKSETILIYALGGIAFLGFILFEYHIAVDQTKTIAIGAVVGLILILSGLFKHNENKDTAIEAYKYAKLKWKELGNDDTTFDSSNATTEIFSSINDNKTLTYYAFILQRRGGRAAGRPATIVLKKTFNGFELADWSDAPTAALLKDPFMRIRGPMKGAPVENPIIEPHMSPANAYRDQPRQTFNIGKLQNDEEKADVKKEFDRMERKKD